MSGFDKIYSYSCTILETYLDSFGHMNQAMYLTLYEQARWEFLTEINYGFAKIKETGFGPVMLEEKIKFLKELKARDKIIIESQLVSYEKKIGVMRQKMLLNGEICSSAEMIYGLFDIKARKLVLPTTEWLKALAIENDYKG